MTFRKNGNQYSISIPRDEEGFTGRECPEKECQGYFKIELGTGLKGENLPCYCPYCGYKGTSSEFWTKEQIEYAKSVVLQDATQNLLKMMKTIERRPDPRAFISFGIKVVGKPYPIHRYREKQLEQQVVCENCTLRYAIYGVFGYCPDCATHNSLQILNLNLDIVLKMLHLAGTSDPEIAVRVIENALEDAISSFDGFGRELMTAFASKAVDPEKNRAISFQNICSAREKVKEQLSVDFAEALEESSWKEMVRSFQKRHLISHKMGVVDQDYIKRSGDSGAVIGRKIQLGEDEIRDIVASLKIIGRTLFEHLRTK